MIPSQLNPDLPAGVNATTGEIMSLAQLMMRSADATPLLSLTDDQKAALVRAYWLAGGWHDIYYGSEGLVDVGRAMKELDARSEMGLEMELVSLRAIAMIHEDAGVGVQT